MRLLTVDIGNTEEKGSVYENLNRLCYVSAATRDSDVILNLLQTYPVDGIAVCQVGGYEGNTVGRLQKEVKVPILVVGKDTPVPLKIDYDREGLGSDRIAGVMGVASEGENVLLADAGTALTLDLVNGRHYRGGNISPGINMRLEALHRGTAKLPDVGKAGVAPVWGHTTEEAIRSGVERGMALEVAGAWRQACEIERDTKLILTGGDAKLLSRYLYTLGILHDVQPDVVERGLIAIFEYNYNNNYNE